MATGPKKLDDWLGKKGLTVTDGAERLGVSRQTLHKWLRGSRMRYTTALLVQHRTGIPAEDFDHD
jgi:transcriptional regulator with XRE-family HTH domain